MFQESKGGIPDPLAPLKCVEAFAEPEVAAGASAALDQLAHVDRTHPTTPGLIVKHDILSGASVKAFVPAEVVGGVLRHLGGGFLSGGFGGVVLAGLLVGSAVFFDTGGEGGDDVHSEFSSYQVI